MSIQGPGQAPGQGPGQDPGQRPRLGAMGPIPYPRPCRWRARFPVDGPEKRGVGGAGLGNHGRGRPKRLSPTPLWSRTGSRRTDATPTNPYGRPARGGILGRTKDPLSGRLQTSEKRPFHEQNPRPAVGGKSAATPAQRQEEEVFEGKTGAPNLRCSQFNPSATASPSGPRGAKLKPLT